jgi:hypothetical protein
MADALEPGVDEPASAAGPPADGTDAPTDASGEATPPMLPSRRAYLLSFAAVALAGIFGAVIGYGVTDVGATSDLATFFGILIGAVIGAVGVGVVAVLVLRAMAEWNRQQALPEDQRPARQPKRS